MKKKTRIFIEKDTLIVIDCFQLFNKNRDSNCKRGYIRDSNYMNFFIKIKTIKRVYH